VPPDPINDLVANAHGLPADQVPQSVLAFQQKRMLDNLACLAAGYQARGVAAALDLARRWSGCQEAILIGSSERMAAPQAALVNSIRARALDYCDVIVPGWHPSSSDVPVALAAAELAGSSGLQMLAALAVAQDFGQRINLAAQASGSFLHGFDANILGLFSGVVVAARLLGLDRAEFADAVGLALDFGIGTLQHYQDKALSVRFGQGLVARQALEAAFMAQSGITGPKRVLMGESGFFRVYADGSPDLGLLRDRLGEKFFGQEATCFKPYPHCSIMLALTEALLAVRADKGFPDLSHAHITLRASPRMLRVCGQPYHPQNSPEIDAQFSAQYVIANAIVRGRATPAEFTASAASQANVVQLAKDIELIEEHAFSRFDQCEVEIVPASGHPISIPASFGRGWPENPLSQRDLREKFLTCCSLSPCSIFAQRADRIIHIIEALHETASVGELIHALSECVSTVNLRPSK